MRVVGIDPAPKKGLSVFDGEDHSIPVEEAASFISRVRAAGSVLVTWDAPLSGPPTSVLAGARRAGRRTRSAQLRASSLAQLPDSRRLPASPCRATLVVSIGRSRALWSGCRAWASTMRMLANFRFASSRTMRSGRQAAVTSLRSIRRWRYGSGVAGGERRTTPFSTRRTPMCAPTCGSRSCGFGRCARYCLAFAPFLRLPTMSWTLA